MKTKEIVANWFFHDGKAGVREIVSIRGVRVTYRVLAAKMISAIGTTSSCDLSGFATWAKTKVNEIKCKELLIDLAAKRLRLPRGEQAFMGSIASECTGSEFIPKAGSTISYSFNETRQARGVEKKGLATVDAGRQGSGGDITLTALGAAWIRDHCQIAA